ncbi:MAG: insulinase family protein [Flavobacteriales bacterium]|nr:insulinase family protein [Flavobacteriales bacterium]MBP6696164.1 insulinase family protein [Flavobacteriales bacterium]
MNRRPSFGPRWFGAIAFLIAFLFPALMNAQIDRTKPPKPSPAPDVNIGAHETFLLANGMRVIVVENHKQPLVSVQVKFDIEPVMQGDKAGYIDMVGELLTSGTGQRTKEEIDEAVDRLGADLSGASDGIYASCLKKNFSTLFGLVQDVTLDAKFPDDEFEKARKRTLSNIQGRKDDPDAIAELVGRVLTFNKGYPYGEVATEKSVNAIESKHLRAYYQRFFQPSKGFIVFVGDITEQEARQLAEKAFGSWTGSPLSVMKNGDGQEVVEGLGTVLRPTKAPGAYRVRRVVIVDRPGAPQSVVRIQFPLDLKPNDPMALAGQVMNTILGGGVFNARLMQNLREDKGYTYGAYSSLESDRYCGNFNAGASVRTGVTDSALTEMIFELENMRLGKVKADELELAKSFMAGSFARSLEDPRTVARFALNTYLNQLPEDHYTTYLKRLDTISAAGVLAAAERFLLPDNATILVVGDKDVLGNKLVPLSFEGTLVQYDENGDLYRERLQPVPAGVTAETVLEAYFKAIGGREAAQGVRSLKQVMGTTTMGMPVTITQWNALPNKYAMEMRSGEMLLQRVACDGIRAKRSGMDGEHEIIEMELEELQNSAAPFPELNYSKLGRMTLAGIDVVDGAPAYKLTMMTDMGTVFHEYYSVERGLKLRREEMKATEQGTLTITSDTKDYREVKGLLFPHLIIQKGAMDMTLVVTSIALNGADDEKLYVVGEE